MSAPYETTGEQHRTTGFLANLAESRAHANESGNEPAPSWRSSPYDRRKFEPPNMDPHHVNATKAQRSPQVHGVQVHIRPWRDHASSTHRSNAGVYSPTDPSASSVMMSKCPRWRAYSWTR
jgi:hypothetical protein